MSDQIPKADFYVSPDGDDRADGSRDRPFATLARARNAVRQLRRTRDGDITVLLRGGEYRLTETVVFGIEDAAPEGATTTYAACPPETPVLTPSVPITGWRRADDAGLCRPARGRVWVADAPAGLEPFFTLYAGGRMLPRARGEGFFPERGDATRMTFPPGAAPDDAAERGAELVIVPERPWVMNYLPIASVDPAERTCTTALPATYTLQRPRFGHFPDGGAWIENHPRLIDRPGEWALDTREGKLYLRPVEGDEPGDDIAAPALTELIRVEGHIDHDGPADEAVRGLVFRGLTFTRADRFDMSKRRVGLGLQHDWELFDSPTAMVRFRGAEECRVERCRFADAGATGLRMDLHAQRNVVAGCTFERLGGCGILLAGYGPGEKDVNRENRVTDNRISNVGELLWHSPGVFVWQSGHNRIAHNLIHHVPYSAAVISGRIQWDLEGRRECAGTIRWAEVERVLGDRPAKAPSWADREPLLHGRCNVFEANEIHHVMEVLGDGNCVYVSGTGAGNIVRRNVLHDVESVRMNAAIRCDDDQHGTIIDHNVVLRCCGEGFIIKGANDVVNNFFVDVRRKAPDGGEALHTRGYVVLPYGSVAGARIRGNVFYCREADYPVLHESPDTAQRPPGRLRDADADRNLYWNEADPQWGERHLADQRSHGIEAESRSADPKFADVDAGDLTPAPDSPMREMGIDPPDVADAGPREPQ